MNNLWQVQNVITALKNTFRKTIFWHRICINILKQREEEQRKTYLPKNGEQKNYNQKNN